MLQRSLIAGVAYRTSCLPSARAAVQFYTAGKLMRAPAVAAGAAPIAAMAMAAEMKRARRITFLLLDLILIFDVLVNDEPPRLTKDDKVVKLASLSAKMRLAFASLGEGHPKPTITSTNPTATGERQAHIPQHTTHSKTQRHQHISASRSRPEC